MKIGIFGGTFNPVHAGHLINAEYIRQEFSLDRILFVPASVPVHKNLAGKVTGDDRFAMIECAIAGNNAFAASRIEIDRAEPSYTITTVQQLGEWYSGDELALIIGSDSLAEFHTWKDADRLIGLIPLIVMRRGVMEKPDITLPRGFQVASNPIIDVSSSMVRELLSRGCSVRYLVPDPVITYIENRGLYRH